jgi:hypothetical protein
VSGGEELVACMVIVEVASLGKFGGSTPATTPFLDRLRSS